MPRLGDIVPRHRQAQIGPVQCDLCARDVDDNDEWAYQFRGYRKDGSADDLPYVPVCHQCVHRLRGADSATCIVCKQQRLAAITDH
jgi:hypothetical protein